jgi:hypothetical protein
LTLSIPAGTGALALGPPATGGFFYRPFLRSYRRVVAVETPPLAGAYLAITGGPCDYLLALGAKPGFAVRSMVSYPADLLREWFGLHD